MHAYTEQYGQYPRVFNVRRFYCNYYVTKQSHSCLVISERPVELSLVKTELLSKTFRIVTCKLRYSVCSREEREFVTLPNSGPSVATGLSQRRIGEGMMKKSCQVHYVEAKVNEPAQPAAGFVMDIYQARRRLLVWCTHLSIHPSVIVHSLFPRFFHATGLEVTKHRCMFLLFSRQEANGQC